jgi:formylglycine-generating enzyme required for sulfatase activity
MPDDSEPSIGAERTANYAPRRKPTVDVSLGDERTLGGGGDAGQDTFIDDIEVVDLTARYRIEGTLGQGGMGAVLLATDTRLDRKVAIKRILGEAAGSKTAIMRFLTEAKAIAALSHPNVVQIYDYGRAKDGPFLIMEFVDGGSLADRCSHGGLPLEEAINLSCQLCDGLAKAHDAGIIHRDIKPANVLLSRDGHPKLTDFGLAKAEAHDFGMTMNGAVMGTPDFMPPEQRRNASEVDHRSDLWSLAATVYQMVTGRSPKIIRFNDIPAALQDVLGKALEDRKDARYQTARDFRDALRFIVVKPESPIAKPAAAVAGDLQDGQCKGCGTVNPDLTRKFCRKCGDALRVPCLKCNASIPAWDRNCGECGGNQSTLLEAKRAALATTQAQAQLFAKDADYAAALACAQELSGELHPDLANFAVWSQEFLVATAAEQARQQALASEHLREAPSHNSIGMAMKRLPAGTFTMGMAGEPSAKPHKVILTKAFYIGVYPVTNAQWKRVMGWGWGEWKDAEGPVEGVNWDDANEFCRRLSKLPEERAAGRLYRLPTEAEWEYACRAGTTADYSFGDDLSRLGDYAWFQKNSGSKTHPVGRKKPNPWGLYDIHGNVWEWCGDLCSAWHGEDGRIAETDPQRPSEGSLRGVRGGSWRDSARDCRSGHRSWHDVTHRSNRLGFRIAFVLDENVERKNAVGNVVNTFSTAYQRLAGQIASLVRHRKNEILFDAKAHTTACDYRAAIQSLDSVPAPLRDHEVETLLKACDDRKKESNSLIATIAERIQTKSLDGLLHLVNRAVALRSDRKDLAKLQSQLAERCDARLSRARAALDAGDAKAAATAFANAANEDFGPDQQELISRVRRAVDLEDQIVTLVKDAKSDGRVTPQEAMEIVTAGEQYLSLNPKNQRVADLVTQSRKVAAGLLRVRNSIGIELKLIPSGTFTMGQKGGETNETPHKVTLTKPYYMGVYPVTNAQWKRVMGNVPSEWKDADRPVERVSWNDVVEFCRKLSALPEEQNAGRVYRLPTEAEWECACRAGTTTPYSFGELEEGEFCWDGEDDDGNAIGGTEKTSNFFDYGWCEENSEKCTRPAGMKKPNPWGLFDMHGNVREWCYDWYDDYRNSAVTDPQGPSNGSMKVIRGGSWNNAAGRCGSVSRFAVDPSVRHNEVGFRLALSLPGGESPGSSPVPVAE